MPDRRRPRRFLAALALGGLLLTTAVAPAALGQEAPGVSDPAEWKDSTLQSPFSGSVATVSAESFAIDGTFVKAVTNRFERITSVRVTFSDGAEPATPDPEAEPPAFQCVPDDPAPFIRTEEPSDGRITFSFTVPAEASVWPCNGTYQVVASAQSNQEAATYDLNGTLRVAVPPAGVSTMAATVAGGDKAPDPETGATADDPASVKVTWDQLVDPDTQYPDFVGYRVQRAGPAGDAGFATVGDPVIAHDAEMTAREFTDTIEAPGEYRYRVQSLRAGPDGTAPDQLVPSASDTPSVGVDIAGPPTTTTAPPDGPPTTRRSLDLPDVGRGTNNPRPSLAVPSPPTTLDTGFEDTLDYGDLPEPGDELAGEGQSVIQNEGEGPGLLGPVAGAMVLLGWAGHVAYLNRLAKQF